MQPRDAIPSDNFQDPTWQLLIELSLPFSDAVSEEPAFLRFMQAVRKVGLRQAQFERLREDILRAAAHAAEKPGGTAPAPAAILRLYAAKKEAQGVNRHGDSSLSQQGTPPNPGGPIREGNGWGYFLSQRTLDQPEAGHNPRANFIELFVYREGG